MSRLYQAPLMLWASAFIAGVAVAQLGAGWLTPALFIAALVAAISASRLWIERPAARLSFVLLLLTPLALAAGFWRAEQTRDDALEELNLHQAALAEQPLTVTGVVADHPQLRWQRSEIRLRAERIALADESIGIDSELIVRLPLASETALGDRVQLRGFRVLLDDPGATNWSDYAARRRVAAIGEADAAQVLGQTGVSAARRALDDARAAMNRSLAAVLPPPLAGVAQGMVTGSRDSLDRALRDDFNAAGLSHLIVISGSNVTLLAAIVIAAAAWLLGRRAAGLLAIAAALGYCLFVGPDPPVVRATVMAVVFIAAHLLGRPASAPYAITLAAAGMIAVSPHALLDISFQLSFAGAFAIAALAPTLTERFLSGEGGLRGALLDLAMINVIGLLATMPLIALHFERVSLVALPANLLATPLFAWMFLGSAAAGLLGLISESLGAALAWPLAWLPLRWFVLIGESLAAWPAAAQTVAGFNALHAALIYAAMAVVATRPYPEHLSPRAIGSRLPSGAAPILAAGLLAAAAAAVWLAALERGDDLQIHFLDVGQGDAALIRTPSGQTVLIDGGPQTDALLPQLRDALPAGARRLDLVIGTHPQIDHLGGLLGLFGSYEIGRILVAPPNDRAALGRRLRQLAAEHGVEIATAHAGMRILLPGDDAQPALTLDVLWPDRDGDLNLSDETAPNLNAASLVIRLAYGEFAALFAADIGAAQELALARRRCGDGHCELRAQLLKIPHHGSGGSTTDLLLRRARPNLAVISAGASNPHGHPHPDVLALLHREAIPVLRTDLSGRITVVADGGAIAWRAQHEDRANREAR